MTVTRGSTASAGERTQTAMACVKQASGLGLVSSTALIAQPEGTGLTAQKQPTATACATRGNSRRKEAGPVSTVRRVALATQLVLARAPAQGPALRASGLHLAPIRAPIVLLDAMEQADHLIASVMPPAVQATTGLKDKSMLIAPRRVQKEPTQRRARQNARHA